MYADQAITSAPRDIKYSMVTISSVNVSWNIPDVIGGDVIYYSLCVREKQNGSLERDCQTTIVEPTQLSVVINGLRDNTSYGIRVRAENLKRPGNYSKELIIRTPGETAWILLHRMFFVVSFRFRYVVTVLNHCLFVPTIEIPVATIKLPDASTLPTRSITGKINSSCKIVRYDIAHS